MSKMGIYKITNTKTGKFYIGSSYNMHMRKRQHYNELRRGGHSNFYLQNSWNKYGEKHFKFEIVEEVEKREYLMDVEQSWLDKTRCYDRSIGYNIARKADAQFDRMPEETIKEIARLHRKGVHYKDISKNTGISVATIHVIKNGNIYQEITGLKKVEYRLNKLNKEEVLEIADICKKFDEGPDKDTYFSDTARQLSEKYKVSVSTIFDIRNGRSWSKLTGFKGGRTRKSANSTTKKTRNNISKSNNKNATSKTTKREVAKMTKEPQVRKTKKVTETRKHAKQERIAEIWESIESGKSYEFICSTYSVSKRYINRLKSGEIWSSITGVRQKPINLVKEQAIDIFTRLSKGEGVHSLAEEYKVHRVTIERIRDRKTWKKETEFIQKSTL